MRVHQLLSAPEQSPCHADMVGPKAAREAFLSAFCLGSLGKLVSYPVNVMPLLPVSNNITLDVITLAVNNRPATVDASVQKEFTLLMKEVQPS